MVDALEIGYAIKDRRAELGMMQAQVARAADVSERCLWSPELARSPGVQLDKLTAVLGALGMRLEIRDAGRPVADTAKGSPAVSSSAPVMGEQQAGIDALAILMGGAR